jgi:carotenoid cleavage dioxygenase-like enzyme
LTEAMSDSPFLTGGWAPLGREIDISEVAVVQGEVPEALSGTFVRNGPDQQFPPRGRYHAFDGDGMLHDFRFEGGRVSYRNRWIRTARFELERQHGRALFGGLGDMAAGDPISRGTPLNPANINLIQHAGRTLALWEAGLPHEVDPESLETLGTFDFEGELFRPIGEARMPGIMTAHPRFDPRTGELLMFGNSPIPPNLLYHGVDANGRLLRTEAIDLPFPAMIHDFAITEHYAIWPVFPANYHLDRVATHGSPLLWEPECGGRFGVTPRDGGNDDTIWLETDPCYVFHLANAYEEGHVLVVDTHRFARLPEAVEVAATDTVLDPPYLVRFQLDLKSGAVKQERLGEHTSDFPRINDAYATRRYRHLWSLGDVAPGLGDGGFQSILHYDLERGTEEARMLPGRDAAGEPVFVPTGEAEDEGVLLSIIWRAEDDRSELLILDAQNVTGEPVATLALPHRVPSGFHGNWLPHE